MKKIVFVTGTRADYGKMKPLMKSLEKEEDFETFIYVCGMHLNETYGGTYREVIKDKYKNIYVDFNIPISQDSSENLGNTILYMAKYVQDLQPDMIVVHGDRIDALAGAVVGALNNILVAHVEGGEVSGTIDESIRHAVSKFAHVHLVCNEEAAQRLIQMGEEKRRIYVIGSPDIDIMMSDNLPDLVSAKSRYDINFEHYGILTVHPVTTENELLQGQMQTIIDSCCKSGRNFITIYPNNDLGSETIIEAYQKVEGEMNFRIFPSLRFEYFLTLLKNADFVIGNSSAGIREAGIYGVPSIDIGTRQQGRYDPKTEKNIQHVDCEEAQILNAIEHISEHHIPCSKFGDGHSTQRFLDLLKNESFWSVNIQKRFIDLW